ncbi:hypothetical protein H1R20_g10545, partial [Candolleomyces eurysporus]
MKLLAAQDPYDDNKALQDFDNAKALISKLNLTMAYKGEDEKAAMKAAFNKCLPTYFEKEKEWTAEDWKKLGFS